MLSSGLSCSYITLWMNISIRYRDLLDEKCTLVSPCLEVKANMQKTVVKADSKMHIYTNQKTYTTSVSLYKNLKRESFAFQ